MPLSPQGYILLKNATEGYISSYCDRRSGPCGGASPCCVSTLASSIKSFEVGEIWREIAYDLGTNDQNVRTAKLMCAAHAHAHAQSKRRRPTARRRLRTPRETRDELVSRSEPRPGAQAADAVQS